MFCFSVGNEKSLEEHLIELREEIDVDTVTYFNINRQNVLDGAIRALKRKSFKIKARIDINFSDSLTGLSEDGIDEDGQTREFLRLLMDAIANSAIFEGREGAKILSCNETG